VTENAPRLMTREEAAAYCSISLNGFGNWVRNGIVPRPVPGTKRWDRRAIDKALDEISGIKPTAIAAEEDEADRWFREYEENKQRERG
jgi:hypothetical protein